MPPLPRSRQLPALLLALALAAVPAAPALAIDVVVEAPAAAGEAEPWEDEWTEDWSADEELCLDDEDWAWSDEDDHDDAVAAAAPDEDEAPLDEEWADEACTAEDEQAAPEDAPARLAALRATPARRGGVRVRFRLDRPAGVALTVERLGAQPSGRCARPASAGSADRGARACAARPRALRGSVALDGVAGANATTLRTWKGRAFAPGAYRITATPDAAAAGAASATVRLAAPARGR